MEEKKTVRLKDMLRAQGKSETIQVEQVLGANMAQRVLELDLIVPEKKPDIEQVIDVYVKNVRILSIDVLRDQVILRGQLEVKVMYVADLPDQPVHAFEATNVRFTRDIEILGTEPGMMANADTTVELVDYERGECEARKVHVTVVLKIWARVLDTLNVEVYPQAQTGKDKKQQYATKGASIAPPDVSMEDDDLFEDEYYPEDALDTAQIDIIEEIPEDVPEEMDEEELEYEDEVPEEAPPEEESGAIMKVKGNVVNVRNGPGTNFPVVTKVKRGDIVRISDQAFGWFKVILPDNVTTGWIASWLLAAPKG
ncbi:MAG: DUF3794 domain-containing protein [Sporomusaceae bacterium]|nr:DUF3794 domain-containing protein [Sporomusaceae bacterium]